MPEEHQQEEEQKKIKKIYLGVRSLPNGTVVRVEQSESLNVRVSVGKGDNKDSFVMTPSAARALHEMIGGCLKSQP